MKLRSRLALTAAAAMLPVVVALFWYDAAGKHSAAEERLIEYALGRISSEREACEGAPARWSVTPRREGFGRPPPPRLSGQGQGPPPGPPPRAEPAILFAYGDDLQSKNPEAPPIPSALLRSLEKRGVATAPFLWPTSKVEVLLRTPWGHGPCAHVLARGTTDPSWGAILPESPLWLLPVLAVLGAVLLAMGPVIARIRKLTEAVKRSASEGYAVDVSMGGRDEIGDLAAAFDAASHEIRAQLKEKEDRERALRDFVANTTHDVMVPLAVLQGHLTSLREAGAAEASVVVAAMTEAHYMASLVHNLTVAARLEAAEVKLQKTPVDLGALIARVLGRHRPIAKQLGVSLDSAVPEAPVVVSADMTLLEQAVSNVTYNAVRYNHAGGHVAIVLEESSGGGFCLRIIDDGPGIAPEVLSRLVERGYRGDAARTRAPDGQGLGLHIAFRAAELHGFKLTLKPSEYGGLEVVLEEIKR